MKQHKRLVDPYVREYTEAKQNFLQAYFHCKDAKMLSQVPYFDFMVKPSPYPERHEEYLEEENLYLKEEQYKDERIKREQIEASRREQEILKELKSLEDNFINLLEKLEKKKSEQENLNQKVSLQEKQLEQERKKHDKRVHYILAEQERIAQEKVKQKRVKSEIGFEREKLEQEIINLQNGLEKSKLELDELINESVKIDNIKLEIAQKKDEFRFEQEAFEREKRERKNLEQEIAFENQRFKDLVSEHERIRQAIEAEEREELYWYNKWASQERAKEQKEYENYDAKRIERDPWGDDYSDFDVYKEWAENHDLKILEQKSREYTLSKLNEKENEKWDEIYTTENGDKYFIRYKEYSEPGYYWTKFWSEVIIYGPDRQYTVPDFVIKEKLGNPDDSTNNDELRKALILMAISKIEKIIDDRKTLGTEQELINRFWEENREIEY
ncbi:MAG: hypothetical protein FWE01_02435 [Firmicutes bacterium]|nr:hypothetical protein [Bacillota bacterium]